MGNLFECSGGEPKLELKTVTKRLDLRHIADDTYSLEFDELTTIVGITKVEQVREGEWRDRFPSRIVIDNVNKAVILKIEVTGSNGVYIADVIVVGY